MEKCVGVWGKGSWQICGGCGEVLGKAWESVMEGKYGVGV